MIYDFARLADRWPGGEDVYCWIPIEEFQRCLMNLENTEIQAFAFSSANRWERQEGEENILWIDKRKYRWQATKDKIILTVKRVNLHIEIENYDKKN